MVNAWIVHVKKVAADKGISYREALKVASSSYKPQDVRKFLPSHKKTTLKQNIKGGEIVVDNVEEVPTEPSPEPSPLAESKPLLEVKKKRRSVKVRILPFREAGKFPPSSRKLLEQVGNEKITSIRVDRSPISPTRYLKYISYYREALKRLDFDDTYHLVLVINDKYELQKNEVLNFSKFVPRPKTESRNVVLPDGFDLSINELIENTRKQMGMTNFSEYNVISNNCQKFVTSILKANDLLTDELDSFINQDVESLFKYLPKGTVKVINTITSTAARFNRLFEGEGMNQFPLPEEPKGLLLKFSSTEQSRLEEAWISMGQEQRKNGVFDVVQTSLYYPENIATGSLGKIGWQQFPRSKNLGYHLHDVEFVSIYYKDGKPEKVYMSSHVARPSPKHEGNWYNYNDCEFSNGYLVVYVARGSHANYNRPGNYKRMKNLANDIASGDGKSITLTFADLKPSIDKCFGDTGICVYKGLRTAPPDYTLSSEERFRLIGRTAKDFGAGVKGGSIHPRQRNRLQTLLRDVNNILESAPQYLTDTQRTQFQRAFDFYRRYTTMSLDLNTPAPYNQTQNHIRNLQRIMETLPYQGYEEAKG